MLPRHWYGQRLRSESHTSSDVDQYQEASEYLDLDLGTSSSSSSAFVPPPSVPHNSSTEYLDLNPGHTQFPTPNHTHFHVSSGDVTANAKGEREEAEDNEEVKEKVKEEDEVAKEEGKKEDEVAKEEGKKEDKVTEEEGKEEDNYGG